jgi:hypothetical protein
MRPPARQLRPVRATPSPTVHTPAICTLETRPGFGTRGGSPAYNIRGRARERRVVSTQVDSLRKQKVIGVS